ncbi:IS4 family transposase [Micromonospora kangleipakensis]|uniref:IS4 family transposase n=1 Tax=Micromonospora kangleipakensis TaxID=1077942 RepID=A0A4Q8BFN2_9ACTN|nr:transposase family protein [Micromonospora kangleipakensis]RZU76780.1 IS4 family transposase [Micromonospora kangleipakensis]
MANSVKYAAALSVREETLLFLSSLLHAERQRRGTRASRRALGCFAHAVLVLRWFLDGTRVKQLATDNAIGVSTAYRYLHEGVDVLAERRPNLHGALLAVRTAGYSHVNLDGTLIETDRIATPGPTRGVGLWWSGKHHHHGGNIQVVSAPDGWPLWTSDVRPGREHDTTCLRQHNILPVIALATPDLPALADLGYQGEAGTVRVPIKKPAQGQLSDDQKSANLIHAHLRSQAERANSLLKTTFKALRRVSLCPWRIGAITAAALVLLHQEHGRAT